MKKEAILHGRIPEAGINVSTTALTSATLSPSPSALPRHRSNPRTLLICHRRGRDGDGTLNRSYETLPDLQEPFINVFDVKWNTRLVLYPVWNHFCFVYLFLRLLRAWKQQYSTRKDYDISFFFFFIRKFERNVIYKLFNLRINFFFFFSKSIEEKITYRIVDIGAGSWNNRACQRWPAQRHSFRRFRSRWRAPAAPAMHRACAKPSTHPPTLWTDLSNQS